MIQYESKSLVKINLLQLSERYRLLYLLTFVLMCREQFFVSGNMVFEGFEDNIIFACAGEYQLNPVTSYSNSTDVSGVGITYRMHRPKLCVSKSCFHIYPYESWRK